MKHLKLLPLLIAAAFYVPHAHAAEADKSEPGSIGTVLICLGLIALAGLGRRSETFKNEQ